MKGGKNRMAKEGFNEHGQRIAAVKMGKESCWNNGGSEARRAANAKKARDRKDKIRLKRLIENAETKMSANSEINEDELFYEFECLYCHSDVRSYGFNAVSCMSCWDPACTASQCVRPGKKSTNKHWTRRNAVTFSFIKNMM